MKKIFIHSVMLLLIGIFAFIPTLVFAEESNTKDVWIDNTVDNSKSIVTGVLIKKDLKTGNETQEELYNKEFSVPYTNPRTNEVINAISEADALVQAKGKEYASTVDIQSTESTGQVWDHRQYQTLEDNDAVLIGDTDYLLQSTNLNNQQTRTHIASGDYGKITYYRVIGYVEYTSDEGYSILDGDNQTFTSGSTDNLTVRASGNIDNFVELRTDGVITSEDNYDLTSGSTIVTLKNSYLNSLVEGEHKLTFVYNDGSVDATLNVVSPKKEVAKANTYNNPATGDDVVLFFIVFTIGIVGLTGTMLKRYN